jgi:hypothetical protein
LAASDLQKYSALAQQAQSRIDSARALRAELQRHPLPGSAEGGSLPSSSDYGLRSYQEEAAKAALRAATLTDDQTARGVIRFATETTIDLRD